MFTHDGVRRLSLQVFNYYIYIYEVLQVLLEQHFSNN